jgi:hypothetical protein
MTCAFTQFTQSALKLFSHDTQLSQSDQFSSVQYCTDVDGDSELTEFNELQCSVHSLTLHFLPEFSSQSFPVL